jgi:hypothetical protein
MARSFACLLMVLAATACASSDSESFSSRYGMTTLSADNAAAGAGRSAPLDPRRGIADRDCHKPIDLPRSNLRCD